MKRYNLWFFILLVTLRSAQLNGSNKSILVTLFDGCSARIGTKGLCLSTYTNTKQQKKAQINFVTHVLPCIKVAHSPR